MASRPLPPGSSGGGPGGGHSDEPAEPAEPPEPDGRSPLLGSWRNVYLLVLGALALTIAALSAFTRHYQ